MGVWQVAGVEYKRQRHVYMYVCGSGGGVCVGMFVCVHVRVRGAVGPHAPHAPPVMMCVENSLSLLPPHSTRVTRVRTRQMASVRSPNALKCATWPLM